MLVDIIAFAVYVAILLFVASMLAKVNMLFTEVREGSVKILLFFRGFLWAFPQLSGFDLRRFHDDRLKELVEKKEWKDPFGNPDPFDIIQLPPQITPRKRWFGGLRVIGFPPLTLFVDTIRITSIEQVKDSEGKTRNIPVTKEIRTDSFPIQDDIYAVTVENVETKEFVPWDVVFILKGSVCNAKNILRFQNFLEGVQNLTVPFLREHFGVMPYTQVLKLRVKAENVATATESELGLSSQELFDALKEIVNELRDYYGFRVKSIQIYSIDPGESFREVLTRVPIAKIDKEVIEIVAEAEAERIKKEFAAIAGFEDLGKLIKALEVVETAGSKDGHGNWVIPFGISDLVGSKASVSEFEQMLNTAGFTKDNLPALLGRLKKQLGGEHA